MHSHHLKKLAFGAFVVAAFGVSAKPSEAWFPTRTLAHDAGSAVHGPAMRAGELVHITVSLQLRNEAQLDSLTGKLMAGKSTAHITSQEFMRTYAPSAASVKAVVEHLAKSGFVNIEIAENRMLISADGTAGTVRTAFNADLHHFTVDGRDAYANVTDAQVPESLKSIVLAVLGLQTVETSHTMIQEASARPGSATQTVAGHSPTEFSTIYDADVLAPATNTTLAIISDGNMAQTKADLATFVAQAGFATPSVNYVTVGSAGTDTSGTPEWDLDSQDALSAAGGAVQQMIFYIATSLADSALTQAYNRAVSDNTARVINVSLGECENTANRSGLIATDDAIFKTAVAQGQVFSVSSGDSGSHQCTRRSNADSYPAVSPYVIALGGTTLSTTGTTWTGETAWTSGGGGASLTETAPTWQKSSGVLGSSTMRGVPDIAFDADPSSGSKIIVNGKTAQYGGTSLAAPLFTGFWARIQSANANALVFPASALYQYGPTTPGLFHDVTSGSNGGYSAKAGWDYTTGFGSLDVGSFAAFVAAHSGF